MIDRPFGSLLVCCVDRIELQLNTYMSTLFQFRSFGWGVSGPTCYALICDSIAANIPSH